VKTLLTVGIGFFVLVVGFIIYSMFVVSGRHSDAEDKAVSARLRRKLDAFRAQDDGMHPWDGRCPDCGQENFYEGPHGGLCVNLECANPACTTRINVAQIPGAPQYERIGRREESTK